MISRSNWAATAVGTAVGTSGWLLGLGSVFWPSHPMWAVFFVAIAAIILTRVVIEREVLRAAGRSQN